MALAALATTLVAATLTACSALHQHPPEPGWQSEAGHEEPTVMATMPGYAPDSHATALARTNSRVEVYEVESGRVRVLYDPWWVGNRHLMLVTVETRPNKTKIKRIRNTGLGQPWEGYVTKLRVMDEWLASQARNPRLVIFVDGEDVLFGGCSEEQFMQDYHDIVEKSGGVELVIGAERGCYECPIPCQNMPEVPLWAYQNWSLASGGRLMLSSRLDPSGQMRFLNSGFVVGPVKQLSELFHAALERMESRRPSAGDQYFITEQFVKHPNSAALDYGSSLVTSLYSLNVSKLFELMPHRGLYNRVTQKQQCFFHANGPSRHSVDKLVEWLAGREGAPW